MRWDALFADLEAAAEAQERLEYEAEVADQARAEYAAVGLLDRLRAQVGGSLTCRLVDGQVVQGVMRDVGAQWFVVATERGQVLVPLHAVAGVEGVTSAVAPPPGEVGRRLGLTVVLRGLAVRRATVRIAILGAQVVTGTIDRVGVDHVELAVHDADAPRRATAVTGVRLIPFPAVIWVALGPI